MDRRMYYRSAGLSAARRAFYSYTAQPRGSYGLPLIFLKMLKAQMVITFEEDKERWRSFLCDYIVFRLYIAKYVLKSYARDYSPLTELYAGFKDAEKDWPGFIRSSSDPGWEAAGISFLPKDLSSYTEKEMDNHHEFFDRIAKEAEAKTQDGGHALKGLVSDKSHGDFQEESPPPPDACLLVLREGNGGVCAVPFFLLPGTDSGFVL